MQPTPCDQRICPFGSVVHGCKDCLLLSSAFAKSPPSPQCWGVPKYDVLVLLTQFCQKMMISEPGHLGTIVWLCKTCHCGKGLGVYKSSLFSKGHLPYPRVQKIPYSCLPASNQTPGSGNHGSSVHCSYTAPPPFQRVTTSEESDAFLNSGASLETPARQLRHLPPQLGDGESV